MSCYRSGDQEKHQGPKRRKPFYFLLSSFAGAVAIPKGQSEYPNLVRVLLQKVYEEPAFIDAVKK
ncbi:hypothetical protein CR159_17950 [Pollutimonas subterranea]|uniref:Uncharacterized protein n=1 Tax=Pollutimonas subterranea TaxID=2045210 RepID=A0A2N4U080_9BURK|nr:hypothetical protein CR159_17950 [Pollutimonas subterranea]